MKGLSWKVQGLFNRLIDIISGCFQPVLGALCAAGIVKGLNAVLLLLLGRSYGAGGTYLILNAIGDSVFYFFPVILGYSAARKFNVQPVIGILLGAVMCYPSIQKSTLEAAGEALGTLLMIGDYYTNFIGIPFVAGNYTSSVVPILVVTAFAGFVQKTAKKYIPEVIRNFFVPFTVLIVSIPAGLLVIGPVVSLITDFLSQIFTSLYSFSAVLTAAVVGILWQVLVIFGLHWAVIPISLMNMASLGYDTVIAGSFGCAFATTAATFAMFLKIRDKKSTGSVRVHLRYLRRDGARHLRLCPAGEDAVLIFADRQRHRRRDPWYLRSQKVFSTESNRWLRCRTLRFRIIW